MIDKISLRIPEFNHSRNSSNMRWASEHGSINRENEEKHYRIAIACSDFLLSDLAFFSVSNCGWGCRRLSQSPELIDPPILGNMASPIRSQSTKRNPTHCLHHLHRILRRQRRVSPALILSKRPPYRRIRSLSHSLLFVFFFHIVVQIQWRHSILRYMTAVPVRETVKIRGVRGVLLVIFVGVDLIRSFAIGIDCGDRLVILRRIFGIRIRIASTTVPFTSIQTKLQISRFKEEEI